MATGVAEELPGLFRVVNALDLLYQIPYDKELLKFIRTKLPQRLGFINEIRHLKSDSKD